jgi:hypothetical protein
VAERTFFGTLRIAILFAVLVFVALGAWLDKRRSTDWDSTLRVTIYPIAASMDATTTTYIGSLEDADFDALEEFFAAEAHRHGASRSRNPFACDSRAPWQACRRPRLLPTRGRSASRHGACARYWAWRVATQDPAAADVQVFALYHARPMAASAVPDSLGLSKGWSRSLTVRRPGCHGSNHVITRARVAAYARCHGQVRSCDRATAGSSWPR